MPSKFGHSLSSDIESTERTLEIPRMLRSALVFSRRSQASEANRFSLELANARASGKDLVDLTLGNPTAAGITYDAQRVKRALTPREPFRYEPHPFGLPSARAAIAALWAERGIAVPAERVIVTASTSEAYGFAFKLLCDPGDEVLVPAPSYPLIEHLAVLDSVTLVPYPLVYESGFFVDLGALERSITEKTRAIVVVSPNNPTGSYLKRDELSSLGALGLPIISDEVFAEYPLESDATRARSVLEESRVLVIALDGLSKLAALPQVKVGWMTLGGPDEAVREALTRLELTLDTFLSANTIAQEGLGELLEGRSVAATQIRSRLAGNHAHLVAACAGTPVTPLRVEGGWYATLRLPDIASDEDWALAFAKAGVLVHPGYFYDFPRGPGGPLQGPHVVLSLLCPHDDFRVGVERLLRTARERA
jgi:aspartate/methionine/tyrosine aminotransferase